MQQTSGPDRVCVYGGDFESFDLLFDFVCEAGGAGPVYDAMIERERKRMTSALSFFFPFGINSR